MTAYSPVFHRNLNERPRVAVSGDLAMLHAAVPLSSMYHEVLDISSGAGVTCLGHSSSPVIVAMQEQAHELAYVHAANWTTGPAETLAMILLNRAGGHFKNGAVMFLNTGAEAIEAACKLSMQFHLERGRQRDHRFIARSHSYHGASMFTLCLGDHPRKYKYPLTKMEQRTIMRTWAYQPLWDQPSDLDEYRRKCIDQLVKDLSNCQANSFPATVVIEPIGGTCLAIEPGDAKYLAMVTMICKDFDATLIYDEILCSNYRTGKLFAYQAIGARPGERVSHAQPDIICMGKGLTAGYFPLSAVIVSDRIVDVIRRGSGQLWHSSTNQNHPIGCAAGVAAMKCYDYESTVTNIKQLTVMLDELAIGLEQHPRILKVTGMGTLRGIRLLLDRAGSHIELRKKLMEAGVAAYTEGGTVNGADNMILLAPPYNVNPADLRDAVSIILNTLDTM